MRRPRRCTASTLAIVSVVVLIPAAALLSAFRADAATLQLAGPAGASVSINGSFVGFLPMPDPLTMPAGTYDLACEAPGYIAHHQKIVFERDGDWRHVTVRLLPYSRRTAVFSNLALAGLGPRYLGHPRRGWIYSLTEAGGLLTAVVSERMRSSADKEYLLAMDAYRQAVNADDIAVRRAAADKKYRDMKNAADLRDLGLTVAIGAVAVSMLDAWLSFDHVTAGAGEWPSSGGGAGMSSKAGSTSSFHSAVRLSF